MADSAAVPRLAPSTSALAHAPRHTALVRVTHWITAICFSALLLSGVEIVISHPRFYWGEVGNVLTPPLFVLPIPASRSAVPTGYGFVLPDQNGWSRYLHFQSAWIAVITGFAYCVSGLRSGHFRRSLLPARGELSYSVLSRVFANHLRLRLGDAGPGSYNVLQRLTYLGVVFILFPLMIWTGLAMSPAIASVLPPAVTTLGGQQSARTIHFVITVLLVIFLLVHILMVWLSGFRQRMGAMITGRSRVAGNS